MEGASKSALAAVKAKLDELEGGDADLFAVGDQLFAVADLLDTELGLRRALADPGTAPEARGQLVDRVFNGQLSDETLGVVRTLATSRWSRAADLLIATEQLGAQALFMSAGSGSGSELDNVEDELFRFARLVEREPRLALALSDPTLPDERKRGLVERLLGDRASETTVRLVSRIAQKPRGRAVPRALEQLAELAAERRARFIAVVTSATPLDDDQSERLRSALSQSFGHDMQLQMDVDPSLMGGLVVRVGDELIDGSVVRRLAKIRRRLLR